ncbi:MAG TPA: glutamate synthase large subunit [Geminicoccus sp.]|jgi:glutamate synthase (NADPH/NADH) large chain|uniref:glutamate synthase large subunit n=1 Tax=Geminicoccus sp. TaxID=2024832 RepID=UPI002E2ECB01|nr:glutamate synthase large subunit [Geminicoccus sp.]HEX2524734.1 glutamate synthase large subunit [Geminicoccus sp.]
MQELPMESGEAFVRAYEANRAMLEERGMYAPEDEHSSCGVGMIAAIDGKPRREVVVKAIEALKAVWHRGAVDADGKTGDGAGIHVQIPDAFFRRYVIDTGVHADERLGVGMVFLPRNDFSAQETCRTIVESEIIRGGYQVRGWRQVPVDTSVLGEKAQATRPEIEQIIIGNPDHAINCDTFERDLYIIRRRIEKQVVAAQVNEFYICSLSCRSIIYKGLFLAEALSVFYPDLRDEKFVSSFAIFHQRYSTNTWPAWRLAQPFRTLAHNGEINTVRGNTNWMKSHETRMVAAAFGEVNEDVKPLIQAGSSDSAALDAVVEALVRAGRALPLVKTLLVPPAWSNRIVMPQEHADLFNYCNCVMEPWDGPAALVAADSRWAVAGMDRNGLRPMRYARTSDGLLVVGSEAGMVPLDEAMIVEKGRVGPGEMIGVDLLAGRFFHDTELKDWLAGLKPYSKWVKNIRNLEDLVGARPFEPASYERTDLRRRQAQFGVTVEDMELILGPMVQDGKEPLGSMGDHSPLAVLSKHYRGLHHFFRQQFAQVTNPPIDPLREWRVMSLKTRFGNLGNVYDEDPSQTSILQLESPVITTTELAALEAHFQRRMRRIDCTFPADGSESLRVALERVRQEAEDAVRGGAENLLLTDEDVGPDRAALPMILAVGAIHSHLIRQELRAFSSITVRSGECMDTHCFAVLIGVGATAVNAYLTEAAIADRHARNLFPNLTLQECLARYQEAIGQGLLKIMSKMGISIISSYRGGYNFEAVGLSRSLCREYLPGLVSRISGIGLIGIGKRVLEMHARAFGEGAPVLSIGSFYRYRRGGEAHALEGKAVHQLQHAVQTDSYSAFKRYTEMLHDNEPISIRDLLSFAPKNAPVPLDEVESITEIRKRFVTPGMSLGALSPEAHETLTIAMNRIGAKADSGEGGEGKERFTPRPNGDNANSPIKQVASGRFGVTAEYLNAAKELEIKVAQGAKPGEGGQLPGFKVTVEIARLRHATPGVTLISPPPHHDIYSIEDLAQLIYDLKQINPDAKVCVKLVSEAGIGTIAAGVAKAKADVILVSGNVGGTGASPQTSIKFAGTPWEMGLSEVNQLLTLNRLRHRVTLRTDGGLKTGRDIVIAAMLGAEEYGIGTASLVAIGCILVRQCHSNTCPVGVCTQREDLRAKYEGKPEHIVNLMSFIAEDTREVLASLGLRSLQEAVGRTDLLRQVSRGSVDLDDLDLNPILANVDPGPHPRYCAATGRNEVPDALDARMVVDARPLLDDGEKMQLQYNVRNVHRGVGTRLSAHITRKYGMAKLPEGHIAVRLRGSAGQSLGAFAVQGLKLEVFGDANDYVGKGLSGGTIVVRPLVSSPLVPHQNVIIGNTCLYGATAGKLFAAGKAGERFAVRNSGAVTVVEGVGDNGCEYMTGGTAVILGSVGDNFAAGMSGGMAFVYDPDDILPSHINGEMVISQRIEVPHYEELLLGLIREHAVTTGSPLGKQIVHDFQGHLGRFWQVVPKEMLSKLAVPVTLAELEQAARRA